MNFKPKPLRIFVYEHITGGRLILETIPSSLVREGEMMLRALINDLIEIPGIEVITSRDFRLSEFDLPVVAFKARGAIHAENIFNHCVTESDATWLIAPESENILERLTRQVLELKRILIGGSIEAVSIAANKLETARLLSRSGIPVAPTHCISDRLMDPFGQWVGKPIGGQGCIETRLFNNYDQAIEWIQTKHDVNNYIIQPYIEGEARSLSILCRDGEAMVLGCNRQNITVQDGEFHYLGGEINAFEDSQNKYVQLANDIASALPGLWGYVGVDFIDTRTGPIVLEINPRLTTSYVGLHESIGVNPAALVLDLFDVSMTLPIIRKKPKPVLVEIDNRHVV